MKRFLLPLFLLVPALLGAVSKRLLFSRSRWRPVLGTLHKMTVWHEHLDFKVPLPPAKKMFNFVSNEAAQGLAVFADCDSHAVLRRVTEVEIWLVATYFAERVVTFTEQKAQKTCSFTCLFKTKETAKNIHAHVMLERDKDQRIVGEVVLSSRRKDPLPEVLNLLSAALIDDGWAGFSWSKLACALAVGSAWIKRRGIKPLRRFFSSSGRRDASVQTEDTDTFDSGMQTDAFEFSDNAMQTEPVAVDVKDVGLQAKIPPLSGEFGMQTDSPMVQSVYVQTQPVFRAAKKGVGVQVNMRPEKGEIPTQTDVALEPGVDHGKTPPAAQRRGEKSLGKIMPEITAEVLYGVLTGKYNNERNRILADGSVLFACKEGVARIVIAKDSKDCDLPSLRDEWASKRVESKLVVVVYCREYDLGQMGWHACMNPSTASANLRWELGVTRETVGFMPVVLIKYISRKVSQKEEYSIGSCDYRESVEEILDALIHDVRKTLSCERNDGIPYSVIGLSTWKPSFNGPVCPPAWN